MRDIGEVSNPAAPTWVTLTKNGTCFNDLLFSTVVLYYNYASVLEAAVIGI